MKQITFFVFKLEAFVIYFLMVNCIFISFSLSKKTNFFKDVKVSRKIKKDDIVLTKIRKLVFKLAHSVSKKSNLKLKKKLHDTFPKKYAKKQRKLTRLKRLKKYEFNHLLEVPTEPWRFCVYPQAKFKINIIKFCEEKFSKKNPKKLNSCKNSHCSFCCDNSRLILTNQFKKYSLGKLFNLSENSFFKAITEKDILTCRKMCSSNYPIEFPLVLPPPPRDKKLGFNKKNAAKSCSDIKKWGKKNAPSGIYWIELGKKGKTKVFCDMETDEGGWTLFFNYLRFPGQELTLDGSKIPNSLKMNSHINLKDAGFKDSEIIDLRFFCTERLQKKYFWHFTTSNNDIINLALTGDQRFLRTSSLAESYRDLPFPSKNKDLNWIRVMNKHKIGQIDFVKKNSNGGLWDSPFGSTNRNKFWTVKGNVQSGGRFECGTSHEDGFSNPLNNFIMTHHSVWFRGSVATDEEARNRYITRKRK